MRGIAGTINQVTYRETDKPHRIAILSMHTSPLAQPGIGDAGGMNVYVLQSALHLARCGIHVEIFTRAVSSQDPAVVEISPGVLVHNIPVGPYDKLEKNALANQLQDFAHEVMRCNHHDGDYDLIHSHYWLSGHIAGILADQWHIPWIHTAHTLAGVKNAALAVGDSPEPSWRVAQEQYIVDHADRLIVNTADEAQQLLTLHHADPTHIDVIPPGVDLETFRPGDQQDARRYFGFDLQVPLVGFVGRIQPLKAPDVLLRAAAQLEGVHVVIAGGPSGHHRLTDPGSLASLAQELSMSHRLTLLPPQTRYDLAILFQAVDVIAVPSYSESFGLVALEAQACGTPVVAAAVGGLPVAVNNQVSGALVCGHDSHIWAKALEDQLQKVRSDRTHRLRDAAREYAQQFSWDSTVKAHITSYRRAMCDCTTQLEQK